MHTRRRWPVAALWAAVILLAAVLTAASGEAQELYTPEQAERGLSVFRAECVTCHGSGLQGRSGPPLVGDNFLKAWARPDRTADDLFYILRTTMPPGRSRALTDRQHADVLAYILRQNGFSAGTSELGSDAALLDTPLEHAGVGEGNESALPPDFIEGDRGLDPTGEGPTQAELNAAAGDTRNWLYQTQNYAGTRYSSLDQIDRTNVAALRPVCAHQLGELRNFQTSPVVYDGVMYLTTLHVTVAIDATTCKPVWKHEWDVQDRDVWGNNRGVAVKDGRVVRATSDGYLVALDRLTGELLWARHTANADLGETYTMAPMIYQDLILVGPAGSENAVRGWIGAFRLQDGQPVWRFNIVPEPGEPGSETWDNPPGIPVGGGAVWTPLSLDTDRGLLHVPATNPAPDFPAALRGGVNLYTNAMIALDVRTGRLVWYDQLVPADDHDWDLTQVSPLYRTEVNGEERDLIATVGKDGVLRVLDRDSHERLFETPVTTLENTEAPVTTDGTYACPGILGGVEWSGPAYNPGTNMLYTPAVDWCGTYILADTVRYVEGENYLGGEWEFGDSWGGWITAVDASDGAVRWRYRSDRPMVANVTTTAGGLVLSGELNGDFLALDAETGDVLYRFHTGGPMGGGIVTYEIDGTQYIAVMSGLPSGFWVDEYAGSPTAFVFALQ
ncbi:MAG: PQQ-binding-like beta-propeller repeat protein [Gemmatimonadota bacterium]|nr:PQQ-binding-like beta-propeller repeat protein [Gemmatimonadota bacterium]